MSISSSREPGLVFPKWVLPSVQASAVPPFRASNALLVRTSVSMSSSDLPARSGRPCTPCSLPPEQSISRMMMSSSDAPKRQTTTSSTPTPSSTPSTKRPDDSNATAGPGGRPWSVSFHREVSKTIAKHGGEDSPAFVPTVRELKAALASDPKQYPKKAGPLRETRATHVRFADGVEWVAVFTIDEASRAVRVISLGPHDRAYTDAQKRI